MCRLAALILTAGAALAQSVDGVLVDSVTRAPLPDVIVTLIGPARYNGTTDEAGAFYIGSIQPGKYVLNIVKADYRLAASQRGSLQIDSDLRLTVQMDPLARITGRLLYADGRPAAHAQLRLTRQVGGSALGATTDAAGHFEFEDLQPGSYILCGIGAADVRAPAGEIWVTTWFPGTLDGEAAEPIPVVVGGVTTREFRVRSAPVRHIRGVVRDEEGRRSVGAAVRVLGGEQTVQIAADGSFDLIVHDGGWLIDASRKDGELELRGRASVFVAHHDLEDVDIRLLRPFSVPVVTEVEGATEAEQARSMRAITLLSVDGPGFGMRLGTGNGPIEKVYPGRYSVLAFQGPRGLYMDSVKYGSVDVTGRTFEILDGSTPIRVFYKRGAPTVSGLVEGGAHAQVIFVPQDETIRSGTMVTTSADSGGRFQRLGLRPGDYYVLAFDAYDPIPTGNGAALKAMLPNAEKIHLDGGASVTLNLKLTPWTLQ
jgi:hypothetical protein